MRLAGHFELLKLRDWATYVELVGSYAGSGYYIAR